MAAPFLDSNKLFATAVVKALCRAEFATHEDDKDIEESPTYVALTNCVYDILRNEREAQDDLWNSDRVYEREPTLQHLLVMADWYRLSYPGLDNSAANAGIHGRIRRLRHPEKAGPFPDSGIRHLTDCLNYRIGMTKLVTSYKNNLGISFSNCQDIDAVMDFAKLCNGKDEGVSMHVKKCYELVRGHCSELFDRVKMHQGPPFGKMLPYMALALHSTNWTTDEMETALVKCGQHKKDTSKVHRVITPLVLAQHPIVLELVSQLKDKRLRDITPLALAQSPVVSEQRKDKRPRGGDSNPAPSAPSKKPCTHSGEHLQGKDDQPIMTPSL
ncbi:MAG: hypothetical protein GOMPHAMPRED_004804 [Gomphillus americanus]|uniref:Uncharacterized protein n=1 Tax=Gomphillus americanus TaxID=1940652 RepID=A0A8H3EJ83_9LECA|nr:MAG: hypothetical protein GOMPHAMPRED_004804 [Gomphillus americanus]